MYEYFNFDMDNVVFEWDEEKENLNFRKHGKRKQYCADDFSQISDGSREEEV